MKISKVMEVIVWYTCFNLFSVTRCFVAAILVPLQVQVSCVAFNLSHNLEHSFDFQKLLFYLLEIVPLYNIRFLYMYKTGLNKPSRQKFIITSFQTITSVKSFCQATFPSCWMPLNSYCYCYQNKNLSVAFVTVYKYLGLSRGI